MKRVGYQYFLNILHGVSSAFNCLIKDLKQ